MDVKLVSGQQEKSSFDLNRAGVSWLAEVAVGVLIGCKELANVGRGLVHEVRFVMR